MLLLFRMWDGLWPGGGDFTRARFGPARGRRRFILEREKSVRWMPWRQEAMKDVARCEKPRGDASDR